MNPLLLLAYAAVKGFEALQGSWFDRQPAEVQQDIFYRVAGRVAQRVYNCDVEELTRAQADHVRRLTIEAIQEG